LLAKRGASSKTAKNQLTFGGNRDKIDVLDPQLAQPLLPALDQEVLNRRAQMQISVLLDRSRPESLTTPDVDQIREAIRCAASDPGRACRRRGRLSEQLAISRKHRRGAPTISC